MRHPPGPWIATALVASLWAGPASAQAELAVVGVSPARHAVSAAVATPITVRFDRPVLRSSVTERSFWAFGRWSGAARGSLRFGDGDREVTLTPDRRFSAGETVMVILSRDLQGTDGSSLRTAGYSFQFWTRSRGSGFDFTEIDRFSTRTTPSVTTRSYGGFASDLDGDGFLDLTIVNEDTDDLRTFLNRGDRSGRFEAFLEPPTAVGDTPSPSEPSDFNGDGNVDVVVANTDGDTISILLGNGDGTFGAAQNLTVGGEPRGVAVLDADGDGDVDVAATSSVDGTVTVLFNDGNGGFGGGSSFGTTGGEWALAAGDMDDDGILDLVVGAQGAETVSVYTGDGAGGFALADTRDAGGAVWMLVLGDLDGDGDEDVATVNGPSDNASLLMGTGDGRLAAARLMPIDPFGLATDLGDLDGDGDLDWLTSSFDGDWLLFENDGSGEFALNRSFAATRTASCALPMDLDNDGVLDLALIDELEDEVILMRSRALVFASDFESGDTGEWSRTRGGVAVVTPGLRRTDHALDVTVDGSARRSYVQSDHPAKEPSLVVRFDLNVRRADLGDGEVEILSLSARRRNLFLTLRQSGGTYRVRLLAREQDGTREIGGTKVPANRRVRLQVEWSAASSRTAGDGRAALLKRGRVRAVIPDLDSYGQVVKRVRLGLPNGSQDAGSGSFLVDEYLSTR